MPMTDRGKRNSVLAMNTLAFTVNFAIWTMFSIIGIRIKAELGLNETEFGLLVAVTNRPRGDTPPQPPSRGGSVLEPSANV